MPKYALTPVEYDEISFVNAGANPAADIVLAKMSPDASSLHVDGPMKVAGRKKKKDDMRAESCVTKTQVGVMSSVLDLGSDILKVIETGGTKKDIAKLLQDHADTVSYEADAWVAPDISKSGEMDPEHLASITEGQKILTDVLAKAGSGSVAVPITDEERAGLPDTVKKYLADLESNVSKDADEVDDENKSEDGDAENEGEELEFDVEYEEDADEDGVAKAGMKKPKIKRMKLVSGSKKSTKSTSSTGSSSFGGFGKSLTSDEVLKSVADPAVQSIVKSLLDSNKTLLAEIEKGKEDAALKAWETVAKTWTHLPGKPDAMAARLRAVEKSLGVDAANDMAAQFTAAQTMAKQSNVFKSAGVGGGEASDTGNKIEKAVNEQIAKFRADGVSEEVAKAKAQVAVFEAHPEYYDEHLASRGA